MGISLREVEENQLLSQDVLDCIPRECDCGAPIEFTDTLRQIYCSNESCIYKIASRLESMAKAMKVDDWGESTCVTVCKEFKLISPYQVFLLEREIEKGRTSSVSAFNKKVNAICDRSKRRVKLWEVVKLASIPNIDTIAYKIFDGYDNLTEAFKDIEEGQVPFIASKLGIKNTETGVLATRVYNNLIRYKTELLFGETLFDVYKAEGVNIQIAITGGVDGFRNKGEFVEYINKRYNGKVNAMFVNTVTNKTDILIVDGDSSSSKYGKAIKINTKYLESLLDNGEIEESEIGKFKDSESLHPLGERIFIASSKQAIERLDKVFNS